MKLPGHWTPSAIGAGVVAGLITAGIVWAVPRALAGDDQSALVGGCAPFNLHAQNQFEPYGAKIRLVPRPDSETGGTFAPNELITVDGWVRTRTPYPTNPPPWNSDAWYHLANDEGWIAFAAVRSVPTVNDPEGGFGEGTDPAPLDEECQGSVRS